MDFPDGTVIDATACGSNVATAYPEKDHLYIRVTINPMVGERVTLQLERFEAKALISTLQRVCENLDK